MGLGCGKEGKRHNAEFAGSAESAEQEGKSRSLHCEPAKSAGSSVPPEAGRRDDKFASAPRAYALG